MKSSIWAYPWDLADEGIAAALDTIVSRTGASTVFVAALYHSGKFLHPHNPKRRVVFPRSGTLYFPPTASADRSLRIRAPVWDGAEGFWEELRSEADARDLEIVAWVLCLHNSGIGWAQPECAVKNAFGDTIHTDLCANSPDVRSFLVAAARDVAGLPVDGLLLESLEYMPFRHGYHHEVIGVPTGPAVDFLMSLCFCEHCASAARSRSLDLDAVRQWTRATLEGHFADPFASRLEIGWRELHDAVGGRFSAFLEMRCDAVGGLLEELADTVRRSSDVRLAALDFGPLYGLGPDERRWENGVDLARQLPLLDEIHPTFYFTDQSVHEQKVREYRRVLGGERPMVPALRAILPQTDSEERLLEQLLPLVDGAAGVSFYNYGFMPLPALDWIRRVTTTAASGEAPLPPSSSAET